MKFRGSAVAVLASCLLAGWSVCSRAGTLPVVATGANVDESRVTKVLYVDPAHTEAADDDKHGTAEAPLATFDYACQLAAKAKDANVGVKIVLAAGIYREAAEVRPPVGGAADTEAPLVIEAAEREQAVIDGADTEGWSPSTWKIEGTRWTHPWPFHHGAALPNRSKTPGEGPGEAYGRGDIVFVNGAVLRQLDENALLATNGTWEVVADSVPGGKKGRAPVGAKPGALAVIQPPEDAELPGAIIQVGVRRRGLTITGRRNVVMRGLLLQHAAEPGGTGEKTAGLALEGCSNVLVEDVLSQWNDGTGLEIRGEAGASASGDITLRRVRLLHNGGSGLSVANVKNLLAEDNETSFNNFRGEWASWIDPQGAAGVKVEGVRGSTWRRQHVVGNVCRGMWWTGANSDVTLEDSVVRDCSVSGLCFENGGGPVLVRRCAVAGTKAHPSVPENAVLCGGILLMGTPDVTLESSVFANNTTTQLCVGEEAGKASLRPERHIYQNNVFYSDDAGNSLYRVPASEGEAKGRFGFYFATLESRENCFWNGERLDCLESYSYRPGNRKIGAAYSARSMKLEEWQAAVFADPPPRTEVGSIWQDPLFANPAEGDFRLKRGSRVAEWGLPSDELAAGQ